MATLNDAGYHYTDGVDDVMAAYVNELLASLIKGRMSNVQTLTDALSLDDASLPIQALTASGADRDVLLAPEALTNHYQIIYNAGGTYNLVIKDDSGGTTFGTLLPGQMAQFIPLAGTAWILGAAIEATPDGKYYARRNNGWDSFVPADRGMIEGLKITWISSTAIDIETGAAYVEGLDRVVRVTTKISKTSLSLSSSTWYHVYLYETGGATAVEIVTTAPTTAYFGIARSKSGDTSRRYLGSILTNGSGNIYPFIHLAQAGFIAWQDDATAVPFRALNSGTATSNTNVSLTGVIPVTAVSAHLLGINVGSQFVYVRNANGNISFAIPANTETNSRLINTVMTSNQTITYNVASGGILTLDVLGYHFER